MTKGFAERIKVIRISKGFSQEDVATHLNISQSAYAKIEQGTSKLDTKRLLKIAELLKVEPSELLSSDNEKFVFNNSTITKSFIEHYYDGIKEVYESQITSLKEEIAFLRRLVQKENE